MVLPRHARSLSMSQSLPICPFSRLSRRWGGRERKPPTTALQRPRSTGRCCCIPTGRLPATYQGRHAIDSVTRHDSRLPVVQVSNLWDEARPRPLLIPPKPGRQGTIAPFGTSLPETACATGAWEGMRSWRPRNPGLGRAGPSDNRHLLGSGMRPNMRT